MKLEPGMYVKTEGLSDADYHAVAAAFMGAGAPGGEYPGEYDVSKLFGWGRECLVHWDSPRNFGPNAREVTVDEVLGRGYVSPTLTITRPDSNTMQAFKCAQVRLGAREQTPCEKLGYRVGDRFEVINDRRCAISKNGDIVVLDRDDGSENPFFRTKIGVSDCCLLEALRPLPATNWTGTALPPVGTHCEVTHSGLEGRWEKVEVVSGLLVSCGENSPFVGLMPLENGMRSHKKGVPWFLANASDSDVKFRPLQSERERAVNDMMSVSEKSAYAERLCNALYDAGYRKTEGES